MPQIPSPSGAFHTTWPPGASCGQPNKMVKVLVINCFPQVRFLTCHISPFILYMQNSVGSKRCEDLLSIVAESVDTSAIHLSSCNHQDELTQYLYQQPKVRLLRFDQISIMYLVCWAFNYSVIQNDNELLPVTPSTIGLHLQYRFKRFCSTPSCLLLHKQTIQRRIVTLVVDMCS